MRMFSAKKLSFGIKTYREEFKNWCYNLNLKKLKLKFGSCNGVSSQLFPLIIFRSKIILK